MSTFIIKIIHPCGLKTSHSTESLAAACVVFREEVNKYPKNDREIYLCRAITNPEFKNKNDE